MYVNEGRHGHYSDYQPIDTSYVDDNGIDYVNFMFKLHQYGKIDGILERYERTLQNIICGIYEDRMIVSEIKYHQYVRVLHDIHLIMDLYNQHRTYIDDFICMYKYRNVMLHHQEGRTLFEKYRGGLAFVQLDDVMKSLRLV
jgi:hypothetical protein